MWQNVVFISSVFKNVCLCPRTFCFIMYVSMFNCCMLTDYVSDGVDSDVPGVCSA